MNGASTPAYPQFYPQLLLNGLGLDSNRVKELILCRDHFVEVFAHVQVERGLNP